jgi:16S rRNA (uracil1498-N3)-methyltransferase
MKLFYFPDIENTGSLSEEESYHCAKVLRLKNNDIVHVTDGKGTLFETKIIEINPKKTELEIVNRINDYGRRSYYVHIVIAPTKNIDRFEWFIEKATEIGVDEITPIVCKNSERKIIKPERFNRIVEAAMKQSYKTYHPIINELKDIKKIFLENRQEKFKYIAHCEKEDKKYLGKEIIKNSSSIIMIGPEGDFSLDEIKMAKDNGFLPVSLGESRLRTETAGVVACDIVSIINQM